MGYDEIMWGTDWLNLKLLMLDKLHYVGEGKGKKREKIATKEEEYEFFRKLM